MSKRNRERRAKKKPEKTSRTVPATKYRLALPSDLDILVAKPRAATMFDAPSNEPTRVHVPVTEELTPQRESLLAASANYHELRQLDEELAPLTRVLTVMRQGYAFAYRGVMERLQKLTDSGVGVHPGVADLMVQSSRMASEQPFSEHDWINELMSVMTWIGGVIDRHSDEDAKAEVTALTEMETARRKLNIPINLSHDPLQENYDLPRDRSLVLVGWRPAVLWLIDRIAKTVMEHKENMFTVVRFMSLAPQGVPHFRLINVPPLNWRGCCNSSKALARVMGEETLDKLTYAVDLLICSEMPDAITNALVGRPGPALAADAHLVFRRWCTGVGAAFIGGVGCEEKAAPDIRMSEFDNLRTFTFLRQVETLETVGETEQPLAEGHYRVRLAGATQWDVPCDELATYDKGYILTPTAVPGIET